MTTTQKQIIVAGALVHRGFSSSVAPSSLDVAARTCSFIASTTAIDSYGDRVLQNWDLSRFRINPVILWQHRVDEPIGRAKSVGVVEGKLVVTVAFASAAASARAESCFQLLQEGVICSTSVGFVPGDVRIEKEDGRDVYILDNNELREISLVSLPANTDAVALSADGVAPQRLAKTSGTSRLEPLPCLTSPLPPRLFVEDEIREMDIVDAARALKHNAQLGARK